MGLFGLLSTKDYILGQQKLKEEMLMAIKDTISGLRGSIESLLGRVDDLVGPLQAANTQLAETIERERQAAKDLAEMVDQEDVAQNEEIANAKAATDAALVEQAAAIDEINQIRDEVDQALVDVEEAEGEESGDGTGAGEDTENPVDPGFDNNNPVGDLDGEIGDEEGDPENPDPGFTNPNG